MHLSLSGFLFEDSYTSQSLTFSAFCAMAKSAGYDGVELRRTQVSPDTRAAQRKRMLHIVRDSGLDVTCLTARGLPGKGAGRDEFFLRYLELCRDVECPLMKISSETSWLRRAAQRAEAYGVTLATNNHVGGELETVEGTRRYLAEVAHPNFGLLYDALHLDLSGEDYVSCIPEFAGITKNVLVHSLRAAGPGEEGSIERNGKRWTRALPDESGVQDWAAILSSFKQSGYDGLITVIESGWPVSRRERVARHCAGFIRTAWAGS